MILMLLLRLDRLSLPHQLLATVAETASAAIPAVAKTFLFIRRTPFYVKNSLLYNNILIILKQDADS